MNLRNAAQHCVGHEAARLHIGPPRIHGGNSMRRCQRYNLRDVRIEYMRIAPHKKRVDSLLLHCGERGGDVFGLADFNRLERDAERICGSTQTREELRILIVHHLPIHQDAYPLEARYCTPQELQLLAAQVIHRDRETRRVSSRSRQARHEPCCTGSLLAAMTMGTVLVAACAALMP